MAIADVDGDGLIDYNEFVAATMHLSKLNKEELLQKVRPLYTMGCDLNCFVKCCGYDACDDFCQAYECLSGILVSAFLSRVMSWHCSLHEHALCTTLSSPAVFSGACFSLTVAPSHVSSEFAPQSQADPLASVYIYCL
jgi:hypothetical protein